MTLKVLQLVLSILSVVNIPASCQFDSLSVTALKACVTLSSWPLTFWLWRQRLSSITWSADASKLKILRIRTRAVKVSIWLSWCIRRTPYHVIQRCTENPFASSMQFARNVGKFLNRKRLQKVKFFCWSWHFACDLLSLEPAFIRARGQTLYWMWKSYDHPIAYSKENLKIHTGFPSPPLLPTPCLPLPLPFPSLPISPFP